MSLTDVAPEVRADVLAALAALLERGIIVEPTGYSMGGGIRIRLADEPATTVVTNDAMKERLNW